MHQRCDGANDYSLLCVYVFISICLNLAQLPEDAFQLVTTVGLSLPDSMHWLHAKGSSFPSNRMVK